MEKIPEHLLKTFRSIKLFRDNLETIENLFVDNFPIIYIYSGNYKYDNIAELLQYEKGKINNFKIEGGKNINDSSFTKILSLSITIKETKLIIFDKDDLKSMGVMKILEDILRQNAWFGGYLIVIEILLSIILSPIIMYFSIKYSPNPPNLEIMNSLILGFFCAFWIFAIIALMDNYILFKNNIYLRYRRELPNFLIRNKDSILVGLICCILGSVIGGLIVYIFTNLDKIKGK